MRPQSDCNRYVCRSRCGGELEPVAQLLRDKNEAEPRRAAAFVIPERDDTAVDENALISRY
jgi:hypothetical protein